MYIEQKKEPNVISFLLTIKLILYRHMDMLDAF